MYTKEQEQLRMSLHQFFGSILTSSNLAEPAKKKESLVALVTEELCKFCKDDKEQIDMIVAKPILKASHYLLQQREAIIVDSLRSTSLTESQIDDATEELDSLIINLDKYIKTIN